MTPESSSPGAPGAERFYTPTKTTPLAVLPPSFSPRSDAASRRGGDVLTDKAYLESHVHEFRARQQYARGGRAERVAQDDVQWELACSSANRNLNDLKSLISSIVSTTSDSSLLEPPPSVLKRRTAPPRGSGLAATPTSWQKQQRSVTPSRVMEMGVGGLETKSAAPERPTAAAAARRANDTALRGSASLKSGDDEPGKTRDDDDATPMQILRRSLASDVNVAIGKIKTVGETRCEGEIFDILLRIKDRLDLSDSRSRSTRVHGYNDGSRGTSREERDEFCDAKEDFPGEFATNEDGNAEDDGAHIDDDVAGVGVRASGITHGGLKAAGDDDLNFVDKPVDEVAVEDVGDDDDEDCDDVEDYYDAGPVPSTKISFSSFIQQQDASDDDIVDAGGAAEVDPKSDDDDNGSDVQEDRGCGGFVADDGSGKDTRSVSFDAPGRFDNAFDNALAGSPMGTEVDVKSNGEAGGGSTESPVLFQRVDNGRSPSETTRERRAASLSMPSTERLGDVGRQLRSASVNVLGDPLVLHEPISRPHPSRSSPSGTKTESPDGRAPILAIPEEMVVESRVGQDNPIFQAPPAPASAQSPPGIPTDKVLIRDIQRDGHEPTASSPASASPRPSPPPAFQGVGQQSTVEGVAPAPRPIGGIGAGGGGQAVRASDSVPHRVSPPLPTAQPPLASPLRQGVGIGSSSRSPPTRSMPVPSPSPPPAATAPIGATSPRRASATRPHQQQPRPPLSQQEQLTAAEPWSGSPSSHPARPEATTSEDREKLKNMLFVDPDRAGPARGGGFSRSQSSVAATRPTQANLTKAATTSRRATVDTGSAPGVFSSNGIFDGPARRHEFENHTYTHEAEATPNAKAAPRRLFSFGRKKKNDN